MKDPTIFINAKNVPIEKALEIMTDDWVDDGSYCAQTVIDLRDALALYIELCSHNLDEIQKLKVQIKEYKSELATYKATEFLVKYDSH
jgi:hypothetical protein